MPATQGNVLQNSVMITLLIVLISQLTRAEEFQLPPYSDVVTMHVDMGGKTRLFLLDSGASTVYVHKSLRSELGKPVGDYRVNGVDAAEVSVPFFEAPKMLIAGEVWTCPDEVGCVDHISLQSASGREIEGALGIPFFLSRTIQFDFDGKVGRTFADTSPDADWGTPVQVRFSSTGLPMVDLRLAGSQVESCIVDTGYTGSVALNWEVFHALQSAGELAEDEPQMFTSVTGIRTTRHGHVSAISLGDLEHKNLSVNASEGLSRIGLGFLRRYRATFQLSSGTLYLAKGLKFDEPERKSFGFGAIRKGVRTIIPGVQSESSAEKAGLQPGDELLLVAGKPIGGKPTAEIGWLIRCHADANEHRVPLTIQRDGVQHELVLFLEKPIEVSSQQTVKTKR